MSETHAIIISASAPMIWGLLQLARSRKIDTFSIFSLGGIVLSFAIFTLGGSPKVLLIRESWVFGATGLVFVISAVAGRPLMYAVARGLLTAEFDLIADAPWFRRVTMNLTVGFGVFAIAEAAARTALAFLLPTDTFFLLAPVVRYAIAAAAIGWIFLYVAPAFRHRADS